jgi:hypothetical protein
MSWPVPDFPCRPGEDEYDLKLEFARLWAKAPHSQRIGYHLFPGADNLQRAMIAQSWHKDPLVIDEYERLTTGSAGASVSDILPSKEQVAFEILEAARKCTDADDKFKGYKLYADIAGYIEKPGTNVHVDNRTQQVVFRVPATQSIEDFELELYEQQTKLLEHARQRPH